MKLFVQRFHFTEVFEDSCRHPAKTNNSTKETGVQAGGMESTGWAIHLLQFVFFHFPAGASVPIPGFVWRAQAVDQVCRVYSSLWGQTMHYLLWNICLLPPGLQPFQASKTCIYSIKFVSAMGWGLNPNYISSCVILFWSSRIVPLRLACYLLMLTCQCLLLQLIPSDR